MKSSTKFTFALSLLIGASSYANDAENAKESQPEKIVIVEPFASCQDCKGEELVKCFKKQLLNWGLPEEQCEELNLNSEDTYKQMLEKSIEKFEALKAKILEKNTENKIN